MSIQVEIQSKRPWQTAVIWKEIHQDIITGGNLVLHMTVIDNISHKYMVHLLGGLNARLSSGANRALTVYKVT